MKPSRWCPSCGRSHFGYQFSCRERLMNPERVCGQIQPGLLYWAWARFLAFMLREGAL